MLTLWEKLLRICFPLQPMPRSCHVEFFLSLLLCPTMGQVEIPVTHKTFVPNKSSTISCSHSSMENGQSSKNLSNHTNNLAGRNHVHYFKLLIFFEAHILLVILKTTSIVSLTPQIGFSSIDIHCKLSPEENCNRPAITSNVHFFKLLIFFKAHQTLVI